MTTSDPPESRDSDPVTIELKVANGKTMTVHRIRRGGTIDFLNDDDCDKLTIIATVPGDKPPPFIVPKEPKPVSRFEVDPNTKLPVKINRAYEKGDFFHYSAQIGTSTREDPIVIIDKN